MCDRLSRLAESRRLPVHGHTEIGHLARFTETAARLIPAEHRRFNFIAMAQQLRGNR
jgi:hypothetical protein